MVAIELTKIESLKDKFILECARFHDNNISILQTKENNSIYIITVTLWQWNNTDDSHMCENCAEDWSSFQPHKTWHTYIFHTTAISSLWSSWLLYELPTNGILLLSLCSMHAVGPNPSDWATTCSIGTLSVPACRKKQRKRARERTNKQREIQSRSLIHSVTNAYAQCSFFINFANLP